MTIEVNFSVPADKQVRAEKRYEDGRVEGALLMPGRHHTVIYGGVTLTLSEVPVHEQPRANEIHFEGKQA